MNREKNIETKKMQLEAEQAQASSDAKDPEVS